MFSGAIWGFIERIATQVLQLGLGIVLANLLTPEDFGVVALLVVFITVSQVFIDSGFTKALIQKKDRDDKDISTVFVFNLFISVVLYAILFVAAPFIAEFFESQQLISLLRVLAISLMINALFTVPTTLVTIRLDFKILAKVNLLAVAISGSVAVYLAYLDYGPWALVYQTLIKSLVVMILLFYFIKWKPSFQFSLNRLKKMFKYGSNLMASSLLNVGVNNLSYVLIPKLLSKRDLGLYQQGSQYSMMVFSTINAGLEKVLLPGLASVQDQRELLVKHMKKITKTASVFVLPIFVMLISLAGPVIGFFLPDTWAPVIPILQIFAVARGITIFCLLNVNILYIIGRTDLALKQEYFKIPIRIVFILIGIQFGIIYLALAELLATTIHFFIDSYYPGKFMKYGAWKQIWNLKKIIGMNLLLLIFTYALVVYIDNDLISLITVSVAGLAFYYALLRIFKVKEIDEPIAMLKVFLKLKK